MHVVLVVVVVVDSLVVVVKLAIVVVGVVLVVVSAVVVVVVVGGAGVVLGDFVVDGVFVDFVTVLTVEQISIFEDLQQYWHQKRKRGLLHCSQNFQLKPLFDVLMIVYYVVIVVVN